MSRADNCLYWQAIFRLMAVQYHCHSLIMACTTLSDTSIMFLHVCLKYVFAQIHNKHVCKCLKSALLLILFHFVFMVRVRAEGGLEGWGAIPAVSAC